MHWLKLESARLKFRKLLPSDANLYFEYMREKLNYPHITLPSHNDLSDSISYIKRLNEGIEEEKWLVWAMVRKDSDELIGTISLWNFKNKEQNAEFGYLIFPKHRGMGFMSEALERISEMAFKELRLTEVFAYTAKTNAPSVAALIRSGFSHQYSYTEKRSDGSEERMVVYRKTVD